MTDAELEAWTHERAEYNWEGEDAVAAHRDGAIEGYRKGHADGVLEGLEMALETVTLSKDRVTIHALVAARKGGENARAALQPPAQEEG